MKTLVIIPAYNEEESILRVVRNLENADVDCDYIVINDCSKDSTCLLYTSDAADE